MSSVSGARDCARHTLSTGYGQGTWRGHIHTIFGLCWYFNTHTKRYDIAIGRGLARGTRQGLLLVASPLRPSCAAVPPAQKRQMLCWHLLPIPFCRMTAVLPAPSHIRRVSLFA